MNEMLFVNPVFVHIQKKKDEVCAPILVFLYSEKERISTPFPFLL